MIRDSEFCGDSLAIDYDPFEISPDSWSISKILGIFRLLAVASPDSTGQILWDFFDFMRACVIPL